MQALGGAAGEGEAAGLPVEHGEGAEVARHEPLPREPVRHRARRVGGQRGREERLRCVARARGFINKKCNKLNDNDDNNDDNN